MDPIEELLYKSGLLADGCWNKFDDYDTEAIGAFARLIIIECARLSVEGDGRISPRNRILDHFGVINE
jgi:hypothetical protein